MRKLVWLAAVLALVACSKAAPEGPAADDPGAVSGGNDAGGGATVGGSTDELTIEGSLVTSGAYDATWSWQPGNYLELGVGITLTSDTGAFGSVNVSADGSLAFMSGDVAEIGPAATGTAAVTLDPGGIGVVCAFSVDDDLTGAPSPLHLSGSMTFVGSDGVISC